MNSIRKYDRVPGRSEAPFAEERGGAQSGGMQTREGGLLPADALPKARVCAAT